jgi:hypothetical protein
MFVLVKHVYPRINNRWKTIVPVLEMLRGQVFRSYKEDVIRKSVSSSIPLFDETENTIIPLEDFVLKGVFFEANQWVSPLCIFIIFLKSLCT